MDQPASLAVPCPKCDGSITVVGTVAGSRLLLQSGGVCDTCGCRVATAGDLVVAPR